MLIIGGSESSKTNALLKLIKHSVPDIDKIYLYVKDSCESKYQLLINVRKKKYGKQLKNPKAFIYYSQKLMMSMKIWRTTILQRKEKC